jgi:DHA2 family multidrug resistance protein
VFAQESLHYTATLSGIVLMPRTLAMMVCSPIIGRLYNRMPPAFLVAFGVLLFAIGSWELSHVSLDTSATELVLPLVVTGAGFAFLFVPLTTVALSKTPRHLMGDAAGLNSFVRQIGGSVGLTLFATLFTSFSTQAYNAVASHVTVLRPELAAKVVSTPIYALAGRVEAQSAVLGFDRLFLLQAVLFVGVIPLLFFLRVPRDQPSAEHVDVAID